jgi:hypothetical protein
MLCDNHVLAALGWPIPQWSAAVHGHTAHGPTHDGIREGAYVINVL